MCPALFGKPACPWRAGCARTRARALCCCAAHACGPQNCADCLRRVVLCGRASAGSAKHPAGGQRAAGGACTIAKSYCSRAPKARHPGPGRTTAWGHLGRRGGAMWHNGRAGTHLIFVVWKCRCGEHLQRPGHGPGLCVVGRGGGGESCGERGAGDRGKVEYGGSLTSMCAILVSSHGCQGPPGAGVCAGPTVMFVLITAGATGGAAPRQNAPTALRRIRQQGTGECRGGVCNSEGGAWPGRGQGETDIAR